MCFKQLCLLCLALLCFFSTTKSQTGPGGVGANDGSSNLEFWYIVGYEGYSNGDLVNSVLDRSGNGRTLTAAGAERPTFTSVTAAANDMASLNFNLDDELETTYQGNSNENMTFGIILNYNADAGLNVVIQHGGRNTIGASSTDFFTDFVGGTNHTSINTADATWTYQSRTFANSGTNRLRYYMENSNTDSFTHTIQNRTSNTWVGGHGTGGGTGWSGGVAEVYKFSRVLNTAEQIIIANYLAAKYDIALTANDIYNEDNAGNGNYDFDVAGIGRIDASNLHDDSQGTGVVRILNPSGLGNNEFLFWGHDNGAFQATELADIPVGVEARLERVWRVSERNTTNSSGVNVGNIDMRWDLTGLGSVTASDLRLLIDTDDDGIFSDETPISGASSLGSNIYEFANVSGGGSGIRNNRRFTLATVNQTQTPLPISLINFSARLLSNNSVKLEWETASELNNDFFTIEKSSDGIRWNPTAVVDGNGNSNQRVAYQFSDLKPYSGISYYRLKQTDFDGRSSYSENITINRNAKKLRVYPNPIKNILYVESNFAEHQPIEIYNVNGVLKKRLRIGQDQGNRITISTTSLPKGVYFLVLGERREKFIKID